jgi:hypothetical protein
LDLNTQVGTTSKADVSRRVWDRQVVRTDKTQGAYGKTYVLASWIKLLWRRVLWTLDMTLNSTVRTEQMT